jgi:hypothetical protein
MKVKSLPLLVLCIAMVASNASAQKGYKLGICTEVHSSMGGDFFVPVDVLNSNSSFVPMEKEFRTGADMGIDVEYFFNDKTGLSIGFHYVNLGVRFKDYIWSYSGTSVSLARKTDLHYLQIPVLLHLLNPVIEKISLAVAGGIYFGILTNYHEENKISGSNTTVIYVAEDEDYMVTDYSRGGLLNEVAKFTSEPFEKSDVGGVISAGLQIKLSEKIFLPLMLCYKVGFTDIKNKSSSYFYQGNTYVYWDDGIGNRPNLTEGYTNSSFGIKTGLRINL